MDKKNTMLLTVIAVATLLVAVVGATFAFFSASNEASGTTTVTTTTETVGAVTVTNPTLAMHLNLVAAQMAEQSIGGIYWATATDAKFVAEAEHNSVARLAIGGGETGTKYSCNFKLTVNKPTALKAGDAHIVLTANGATLTGATSGAEIDLSTVTDPYTVSFEYTGNTTGNVDLVTAAVKYTNLSTNQDHLKNVENLVVTVTNSDINCEVIS